MIIHVKIILLLYLTVLIKSHNPPGVNKQGPNVMFQVMISLTSAKINNA